MNNLHFFIIFIISLSVTTPLLVYGMSPSYVEFENIGRYIAFENKMKTQLDMPIIPIDYKTGLPEPEKQHTTDYTDPRFHNDPHNSKILAVIDSHADLEGLTPIHKTTAIERQWSFDETLRQ